MQYRRWAKPIWLTGAAAVGLTALNDRAAASGFLPRVAECSIQTPHLAGQYAFAHEGVLGTSLDLIVEAGSQQQAWRCEQAILAEVQRLCGILSTYDPRSEISRMMAGGEARSPELVELLGAYRDWSLRTAGAIELNMGGVRQLWKSAAITGQLSSAADLRHARSSPRAFNVDALGKGYVIDRAVEVAQNFASAGLLNIGGDIRAWGARSWLIGVTDPANCADNAPLIGTLALQNAAVATSGSYARPIRVNGETYSHLIDPRTNFPVDFRSAATIVAGDCLTANALSTAACVLGTVAGVELAQRHGSQFWINGQASAGLLAPAQNKPIPRAAAAATAWPKDYEVSVDLTLKVARGQKVRRPYVALWIEDAKGKVVRTITVWGTQQKYLREMTAWWKATGGDQALVQSVTKATREPGKYTLTWDGTDDAGMPLPKGEYTLVLEVNREHGRHVGEKTKLLCQDKKVTATVKATAESDVSPVVYGPKK